MGYLTFKEENDGTYGFYDKEELLIGWLKKVHVGRWQHWCIFLDYECYLSPGCADEVREFQRKLGGKKSG